MFTRTYTCIAIVTILHLFSVFTHSLTLFLLYLCHSLAVCVFEVLIRIAVAEGTYITVFNFRKKKLSMADGETKKFYFDRKNYFLRFISEENSNVTNIDLETSNITSNPISKSLRHALEYFVDDLRHDRDQTIQRFLSESMSNDIFRSLARLLLSNEDR